MALANKDVVLENLNSIVDERLAAIDDPRAPLYGCQRVGTCMPVFNFLTGVEKVHCIVGGPGIGMVRAEFRVTGLEHVEGWAGPDDFGKDVLKALERVYI